MILGKASSCSKLTRKLPRSLRKYGCFGFKDKKNHSQFAILILYKHEKVYNVKNRFSTTTQYSACTGPCCRYVMYEDIYCTRLPSVSAIFKCGLCDRWAPKLWCLVPCGQKINILGNSTPIVSKRYWKLSKSKIFLDIVVEKYTKSGSLSKKLPERSKVAEQFMDKPRCGREGGRGVWKKKKNLFFAFKSLKLFISWTQSDLKDKASVVSSLEQKVRLKY